LEIGDQAWETVAGVLVAAAQEDADAFVRLGLVAAREQGCESGGASGFGDHAEHGP
jgi:hypothetical protein